VLVVGYHNTFPAERVAGTMVSNYLVRQSILTAVPGAHPDRLGQAAHLVYPPSAAPLLAGLTRRIEDLSYEELARFADVDRPSFDALMAEYRRAPQAKARWNHLCKTYAYDEFHGRAALALLPGQRPDFLLLHFQAPDWAAHHFLYFHDPRRFTRFRGYPALRRRLAPEMARYRKTVGAFYEFADAWLGRLLESRDPEAGVMVLSDHGMAPAAVAWGTGSHNEAPMGIVVLSGPGIRPGPFPAASIYDVLPTLMASAGLPVARDLEGRVMEDAFLPGLLAESRIAWVPSYETGERFAPQVDLGVALHEEVEQELRGLGYIQ
jgi:arylsulfatase A-like enzyme